MGSLYNLARDLARVSFGLGVAGTIFNSTVYTVERDHRAVLFNRLSGSLDHTIGEGTHFLIPWVQKPYVIDIRSRPHTISSRSGTKDRHMVNLTLHLRSHPDTNRLPDIVENLGLETYEKVLPPIGTEVLNNVVAQFNTEQLLTEHSRSPVSALVRERLIERVKDYNIVIDDVVITLEFSRAILQKQVALQEAEWAKFVAMKAEQELIFGPRVRVMLV